METRRLSCAAILFLVLCCLALVGAGAAVLQLTLQAERSFGPPASGLGISDQAYLSLMLLSQADDLTRPANSQGPERPFEVGLGEPTAAIASRLESEGLIPDAGAFLNYLRYAGLDTGLQAGRYTLSPRQTPIEIARMLQDVSSTEASLTIYAGWRLEEVAEALPAAGLDISPEVFMTSVQQYSPGTALDGGYIFLDTLPPGASLEGFLTPGVYRLPRQVATNELVALLLQAFDRQLTPELQEGFARQGLSVYQAVTLASMIQREAVVKDEMPTIASVFLNRLADGMKLDSDPTVQYALGYNRAQKTWWTNPLSLDDLQVASLYNTYRNTGLPPGPIASPSLTALEAVANPEQTSYYYFRAACNGSGRHLFAQTFEEHLNNGCP